MEVTEAPTIPTTPPATAPLTGEQAAPPLPHSELPLPPELSARTRSSTRYYRRTELSNCPPTLHIPQQLTPGFT